MAELVAGDAFDYLDAPVRRLAGLDADSIQPRIGTRRRAAGRRHRARGAALVEECIDVAIPIIMPKFSMTQKKLPVAVAGG